jgi:hypothetical protein
MALFGLSIAVAVAGGGLLVWGILQALSGTVAVGTVSAVMGIFSGVGTAYIRSLGKETRDRREDLLKAENDQLGMLQAVGVAHLLPARQRNAALAKLAADMAARMDLGENRSN